MRGRMGNKGGTHMHEIDKDRFGAFVAQLRREKGMTQRELADRLYVSDKAVSKWERGLSHLSDQNKIPPYGPCGRYNKALWS